MDRLRRVVSLEELKKKRDLSNINEVLEISEEEVQEAIGKTLGKLLEISYMPTKTEASYHMLRYLGFKEDEITVEKVLKMLAILNHIHNLYSTITRLLKIQQNEIVTFLSEYACSVVPEESMYR